jgi:hypothetical protein
VLHLAAQTAARSKRPRARVGSVDRFRQGHPLVTWPAAVTQVGWVGTGRDGRVLASGTNWNLSRSKTLTVSGYGCRPRERPPLAVASCNMLDGSAQAWTGVGDGSADKYSVRSDNGPWHTGDEGEK